MCTGVLARAWEGTVLPAFTYSFLSSASSSSLVNRLFSPICQARKSLRVNLLGEGKRRGEKGWMENVTLERAVSRILSPVVDIATEERINKPDVQ